MSNRTKSIIPQTLLLLIASAGFVRPAHAQIVATPTLASAQVGTELYCAAKPVGTQLQVYCFITKTKSFDTLIYNSIFTMNSIAMIPSVNSGCTSTKVTPTTQNPGGLVTACKNAIGWIFRQDDTGVVNWEVSLNGLLHTGHF